MRLLLGTSCVARVRMLAHYVGELRQHGAPLETGDPRCGTTFLLDGVGGFLLTPSTARMALRQAGYPGATYLFDWHRGPRGEMLADLVCERANRRRGLQLARLIRARRRAYPDAPIHVLSYSGGTGIAVFAVEKLGRTRIDTLILGASALSPGYPLGAALAHVRRCYALTSRRDYVFLGLATSLFGTVDRRFGPAAGWRGFRNLGGAAAEAEDRGRFEELPWRVEMSRDDHVGHHTGSASVAFIRRRLIPLLPWVDPPAQAGPGHP